MHQIHFLLVARNGQVHSKPIVADTIQIPGWTGQGPYPSITVRMDFRHPESVGTFLYHCHISIMRTAA